jgi:virginiamycin B lyase
VGAGEAPLNPDGLAYEINRDAQGDLWISDYAASEIWRVHPPTGAYTVYQGMSGASDAHMDTATGTVWWTDASEGSSTLGAISLATGKVTTWTLTTTGTTWGLTIDTAGQVWTTDYTDHLVYRFRPTSRQFCSYAIPNSGSSDYILARGTDIWLGGFSPNAGIIKLDAETNPTTGQFTTWQLPSGAYPQGMALGDNGELWWADEDLGELGRLDPASNTVMTYTVPAGGNPEMLRLEGGKVWYTESLSGAIGVLDPAQVVPMSRAVTPITAGVSPSCRSLPVGNTSDATTRSGTLAWSLVTYQHALSGGWEDYRLPGGAYPWGITIAGRDVWAVDQARKQLVHLVMRGNNEAYLPVTIR